MEADYLLAAIPEPVTILGHPLDAFSLGHAKALRRFKNAFAVGGVPTIGDLLTAVFICSRPYRQAISDLKNPELGAYLEDWQKQIGAFDFAQKCTEFKQYIDEANRWPHLHEPEEGGRIPGAPFIQRVQLILQGRLNHSLEEALNKPWGEALHDYFAFWELEGQIKIFGQDDEDHLESEAAQKVRAEILAELKTEEGVTHGGA
jgi:hypothetical protein